MNDFQIGDRVRVRNARIHIHEGRVTQVTPARIHVTFPTGGYGGAPYAERFGRDALTKIDATPDDTITVGQIWQRKPDGVTYRVTEAGDSSFAQDIGLTAQHTTRTSRISAPGLRSKFVRRPDLEKV